MREALLATIRERPAEDGPRLVYADWLEEQGDPHATAWSMPVSATVGWVLYSAVGFVGSGNGSGSGKGRGRGSGSGKGSGSSSGSGKGRGSGSGKSLQGHQMTPGKNYLIHCGDWHTFVGRCVQQVGPLMFEMSSVSKIENTNGGDNWHILARGDKAAREAASYLHYYTTAIVPLSIIAFEWIGDLPAR